VITSYARLKEENSICDTEKYASLVGFTLAELLICIAILGVIAIFAIPKILAAQQNQTKNTIFKECIAALAQASHEMGRDGITGTSFTVFSDKLNAVSTSYVGPADPANAIFLHNGAKLDNFNGSGSYDTVLIDWNGSVHNGAKLDNFNGSGSYDTVLIDWNGNAGPNLNCDDRLFVVVCYNPAGCTGASLEEPIRPGQVTWASPSFTSPCYKTMFQALF
jgi:prepilin-type N-terminal cleavage/methylation domain-containing protein